LEIYTHIGDDATVNAQDFNRHKAKFWFLFKQFLGSSSASDAEEVAKLQK